ncbi:phosphoribosylanthranilate isomerase [Magnetococcales bacterium HHB-1]
MSPPHIKVCGITRDKDLKNALQAGVSALGFVFYPPSPRAITAEAAAPLIQQIPPFVSRVGLFVNASFTEIEQNIKMSQIDTIQLHGDESPEYCQQLKDHLNNFPGQIIKAIRVQSAEDLALCKNYSLSSILLDARVTDGRYGGTGERFDWTLLQKTPLKQAIILAGGLTPENVRQAIDRVQPWAVDVSSGVEKRPGIKDAKKIKQFVTHVHQTL